MENTNIILIIVVIGILYALTVDKNKQKSKNKSKSKVNKFKTNRSKVKKNNFYSTTGESKSQYKTYKNPYDNKKLKTLGKYDNVSSILDEADKPNELRLETVNPTFINSQFHNDYRDLITAFNNLVPDKKQLFNLPNIPLKYSEPPVSEVSNLIADFISVVNHNIQQVVSDTTNKNSGWDEMVPDPNMESGWDKVQASLGLPKSLYDDPAKKAPVKLIKISNVQKYETEDEIKYSCDIILQKVTVDDQIMVKVDFVQDKRSTIDENNFFNAKNVEMDVSIEKIFLLGYLTNGDNCLSEGNGLNISGNAPGNIDNVDNYDADENKYFGFENLEFNNMTDPLLVQKLLMKKYKSKNQEMEDRTAMLDSEGRDYYSSLPNSSDFPNIAGTRTIFDDMNSPKVFY